SQSRLVIEPSGSLLWSVKLQVSPLQFGAGNAAVGGWLGGGTVGQSMVNVTITVCPVLTVTGREGPPLTEQLDAIPLRVTVWSPVATGVTVMVWFTPICCGVPLSTAKV